MLIERPTYQELSRAFWTYVAETNNDGEGVAPDAAQVERAYDLLGRTGVTNPYPVWPA